MSRSALALMLGVLLIIGIVVTIVILRRRAYIRSLTDRGWTFVNSPTLDITYGLNGPPFGLGYNRSVDDLITGTTSTGFPFQAFKYGSQPGYVVALQLPRPLPEAFVSLPGEARAGIAGQVQQLGRWQVVSADPVFGAALLSRALASVDQLAAAGPVNVSIDGHALVATGAPMDAAPLSGVIEGLGQVAQVIASGDWTGFPTPTIPSELSLYGHPRWIYRPQDDRFLDQVVHDQGGDNHEARDVVLAELAGGISLVAMVHHWTTTRVETTTDSEGRTTSHTVTDHHDEPILEFHLPWTFGGLSLNWPWSGEKVRLESSEFNDAFTIRSDYPKFAMDVFHPRMMEFVQQAGPRPFLIEPGRLRFDAGSTDPALLDWAAGFVVAFFAGVPRFVWEGLGHATPPLDAALAGFRN